MPIAVDAFKPIKSLLGFLPWLGKSTISSDLEQKLQQVIMRLKELESRIVEIRIKFEKRSEELFSKTYLALKRGDRRRAEIYAQETAHVRNLLKLVRAAEHLIVHAIERLKTVNDVRELTEVLLTFGAAIDEVRSQMQGLYPGLAVAFEEINKSIKLLLVETTPPNVTDIDVDTIASEASKVLQEAINKAEKDVSKIIPSESITKIFEDLGLVPKKQIENQNESSKVVNKTSQKLVAPPIPTATSVTAVPEPIPVPRMRLSEEDVERRLLDYIIEHNGFLDIEDFCNKYGVTREEVMKALHRLVAKGLIRLT